jgi:hypothetical protein
VQQNDGGSFAGICVGDGCIFELRSFQIEVLKYKSRIIYVLGQPRAIFHDSSCFSLYLLCFENKT